MAFEERNYLILSTSELDKINFDEVLETSAETVRKSVDGSKTFVKWDDGQAAPSGVTTVESLTTKGPYLTYSEILEILETPEWTVPHT